MSMEGKRCAECGVEWNPVSGFYHLIRCDQYMKQELAETLDRVDYTPPDDSRNRPGFSEGGYKIGYDDGWNDAIEEVLKRVEDIHK